jgi:fatty acid desaturase
MEKLNILRNSNRIAYFFMLGFYIMSGVFFIIALLLSFFGQETREVFMFMITCFGVGVLTMFVHGHFFTLIKQTKNHLRSIGCDPGEAEFE